MNILKLHKPFKFTRSLRDKLQSDLPFKLKINQVIRQYAKFPIAQQIDYESLLAFVKSNYKHKRERVPDHMYYNQHVKTYWLTHPNGTHTQCVTLWWNGKVNTKVSFN